MYNVAIVGATGNVGRKFLEILEERNFPIKTLYLFASKRSAGSKLKFKENEILVEETLEKNIKNKKIDFALFSAGGDISLKFSPIFASYGAIVIDNSSAFRMDKNVPLVVPEVNPEDITWHNGIIANPNCSTIQAMIPLKVLLENYGIKRIVYSTYQAVSGAGMQGIADLEDGIKGLAPKKFPYPIAGNCLPHIDVFLDNGYTKEEIKMIEETKKILHNSNLKITATAVRVPVLNSHSESINVELEKPYELNDIINLFINAKGLTVYDNINELEYPTALMASGKDDVFVGRIRRDFSTDNGLNLWVVADNIRKGAALNAVQIAELLIRSDM
ncbi:aspartate-semialdehyde dehydrogenase [Clostridium tertium]|jgi:aspartate-semialdehyde dehydrogenase|uniref:aspartate-semialdehyde dehydrogenase n=1 Tax=Clostridium TaxID=1485 RepID=UPI00019AFD46|nr:MULTISPECIES: aspartate-semialdehyde dehydrogenase [Clostridium]EEH97603.1 aspartate-semialdehyde dehydrogenase [Clostridium sp. 7_2_43FAA]MBU6135104.1 aspartate-semialdehyde dehydrogenase [Clostridium tertium]MDB1923249.1 aspartate-semialdehyde dehydrogenase [Clostridium tertium]MDB1926830.1 aspartate-semialdehyde dehydrogenase [Clostridium tertium]MDB1930350.1 aspartate-semialdehyde dehydrogenase [Clostridium tertium]